jgi:hypothetical protein
MIPIRNKKICIGRIARAVDKGDVALRFSKDLRVYSRGRSGNGSRQLDCRSAPPHPTSPSSKPRIASAPEDASNHRYQRVMRGQLSSPHTNGHPAVAWHLRRRRRRRRVTFNSPPDQGHKTKNAAVLLPLAAAIHAVSLPQPTILLAMHARQARARLCVGVKKSESLHTALTPDGRVGPLV